MRRPLVSIGVAIALTSSVSIVRAADARAANGPSNRCYGEIVAGIASTWPWAHNDKVDFAPPPGSVALWIKIFGEQVGVSSVRQLQVRFCTE